MRSKVNRTITKQENDDYIYELAEQLRGIYWEDEMLYFLKAILTPKELINISQRLQIIKQLKKGIPQREIAKSLGVGIATVTRGAREIRKGEFENVKV
jgi:TrpR family trp operon transcriptional repressor